MDLYPDPGGPKTVDPVDPDSDPEMIARDFHIQFILLSAHNLAFQLCFTGPLRWNSKWTQCSPGQCTLFVLIAILYAFFKMVSYS